MELADLEQGAKAVACGGHVLSCQELTGLQVGLTLLKAQEKHPAAFLWGKILGTQEDYYIAYGLRNPELEFPQKVFYYAGPDFEFKHLPYPSQESAAKLAEMGADRPFTGQADAVVEKPAEGDQEQPPADGTGEAGDGGEKAKVTELERLGKVVVDIDHETAVVPRGAHRLNEARNVVCSADFRGLSSTEAASLSKYVHFRPPASVDALRALAHADAEFYANFLDSLEGDLPKGCWAVRQDLAASLVTLRSLSWPGYIAYHAPETAKFGGLYCGYAQKSRDLPFLL